ncbi:MAG: hypothetical protein RLY14_3398 [Planctomycetota bacterium]
MDCCVAELEGQGRKTTLHCESAKLPFKPSGPRIFDWSLGPSVSRGGSV